MALRIKQEKSNGKLHLCLSGRFDFSSNRAFRKSCEEGLLMVPSGEIVLDLGGVDYMDSSALGMLLLFKEEAGKSKRGISLENCRETVREILDVVNFGKLFTIH